MTTTSPGPDAAPDSAAPRRGRRLSWASSKSAGPADPAAQADPAWARPALIVLLLATAALYLQNVAVSGNANEFYAAAVQAASKSWKAWFFGGFDASGFITVDKPPASTWVMGLSARIFGYSSWSMLVPQALEAVAAVALLYAAVKRWSGPLAGLVAGAVLALTPAVALIFRFNNPDALLVLLMTAATYCMVRALENASTKWVLLAGTALGFAFLTKMLQGWLIVPALGLAYLVCAPAPVKRRILQLLGGLVAMVVSCGWWIAAVSLWPAGSRPYIGGSENNSVLELVFGYNGLGRIFGGDGNGGGGGGGMGGTGGQAGSSFGGATGLNRLFGSEMGNQISWLLPAALIALVAGLLITARRPRTDRTRAALIVWGGWLLTVGLIFSYMKGTIHPYYTVALAPAIAALIAVGGTALWQARNLWRARLALAAMVLSSGLWSYTLLARNADWHPELRYLVLAVTVVAAIGLLVPLRLATRALAALVLAGLLGGVAGSAAYAVATTASAHTGSIPSVGPSSAASSGFGGGGGGRGGGMGSGSEVSDELVELLQNAGTKWAAATVSSNSAAPLQLASGQPVMALGGFSGSDPAPTLEEFQAYVAAGEVRYFISGGMGGGMGGGRGGDSGIADWVAANYTAITVGGQTVYDLQAA
ncbi:glycosyltransferase family 39 protein [Kineosporia rhizophila]|uniref:ArnT family glycosyltransferase n=1 Tax=Kineosporia rhizophila TaxID=84633 RepID=UPI001E36BBD9|nr:glycosyltransferase family 39 protein [Kineosporia rhizophila]MCE0537098.1 glycosyltransferase family 39 protein [Kineosporia rhizophila]